MMTERLYYTDAYRTTFDARVVDCTDDGRRLYLERTVFYPSSGGQPHDLGTIAGVSVADVVDEGERIAHVLERPMVADNGTIVRGEIDWGRRFDHMQQHTGQHLLSALFADVYGQQTVSVHFGTETSTLDLNGGAVPDERMRDVERRANLAIVDNRPVTIAFEEAATARDLRKHSQREGMLRIVSIEGLDRSACGGTHVRGTGEIGVVLLRQQEKIRNMVRVTFVCGLRAVRRARRDFELLDTAARPLSASIEELPRLVEGLSGQIKDLDARARRNETALATYRARERFDAATPSASGRRVTIERLDNGSPNEWREFALAYCAFPKAVFVAASSGPTSILVASAADAGFDAGAALRTLLSAEGGRGGGSPLIAQGSLPSPEALQRVLARLEEDLSR